MYKCECGKEFDNPQSFNGHKSHCKEHQLFKYGKKHFEENLKIQQTSQKKMIKRKSEIAKDRNDSLKLRWISEQHTCEKCGKIMTEKFGSGRFCSRSCANSRGVMSNEVKEKIKKAFEKKSNSSVTKFCKTCGIKLGRKNKSGYCKICIRTSSEYHELRCLTAKKISENRKKNGTQKPWQSRKIQSYPEKFWQDVLDNNQIDYKGPNVPIKKSDGKSNYFLDFLIEKDGIKIDLEIDGKQHKYPDRIESDKLRDGYLSSLGFKIYRIDWNEINSESGKLKMKEKIDSFLLYLDGCDNW